MADTDRMDLYLGLPGTANDHDLVVEEYDLKLVLGADAVRQRLDCGLRLFYAEWYLDDEAGMPYYRDVLTDAPQSRVVEALFRRRLLSDEEVESITSLALEIDRTTRKLNVDFEIVSSVGVVTVSEVYP